jgi:hypothetical protein
VVGLEFAIYGKAAVCPEGRDLVAFIRSRMTGRVFHIERHRDPAGQARGASYAPTCAAHP